MIYLKNPKWPSQTLAQLTHSPPLFKKKFFFSKVTTYTQQPATNYLRQWRSTLYILSTEEGLPLEVPPAKSKIKALPTRGRGVFGKCFSFLNGLGKCYCKPCCKIDRIARPFEYNMLCISRTLSQNRRLIPSCYISTVWVWVSYDGYCQLTHITLG